jgi:hypothetical protein
MARLPAEPGEEFGHLASDLLRHYHPGCAEALQLLESFEIVEDAGKGTRFD